MVKFWPFILNALLMLILPLVLARFIQARRRPGWGLFGIGAMTFVLSQVGHIPFNFLVLQQFQLIPADPASLAKPINLLIYAGFLGVSSGVFEEVARYLAFRFWAKDARSWGKGLMLGVGHGGIEAILTGILVGINLIAWFALLNGQWTGLVPEESLGEALAEINAALATPWYAVLLGALERAFALCLHLALSLMVLQSFTRGNWWWLPAAIGWHALANGVAVATAVPWNIYVSEAALAIIALISILIIFRLQEPEPPPTAPPRPVEPLILPTLDATPESLERSRYH